MLAAVVQMTATGELAHNLESAARLVRQAARRGAELVLLPENFALMAEEETAKFAIAEPLPGGGPIVAEMAALAEELGIDLILGGLPERLSAQKVYNSSLYLDAGGATLGVYRKIHLFDVAIPDGASYHESASVAAGERPRVIESRFGAIGLSVCYDLRFPELYRALSQAGARILTVPAAFTALTGRAHWHPLLRARAIENLSFVLAAAQYGAHGKRRVTYGHACIVDPWGQILAEVGDHEGVAVAELDFDYQARLRRELPALDHRRL